MCLTHPAPETCKTLEEVRTVLANPSCNSSRFVLLLAGAMADLSPAACLDMWQHLAQAPESQLAPPSRTLALARSQLAPPWKRRIAELLGARAQG